MFAGDHEPRLILIVEDEPDNSEIMRLVVEDLLGHRALLVTDGATAVEVAAARRPNLVLMDLMLPKLDGFEALRRLRTNPTTTDIPVLAITALGRQADRDRAFAEGANGYVSKPFDIDALVDIIGQHLPPYGSLPRPPDSPTASS